jgi:hypothetical protein
MGEAQFSGQLRHKPQLEFAERDAVVIPAVMANDPGFSEWGLRQIGAPNART